jgi:hypothetical protein
VSLQHVQACQVQPFAEHSLPESSNMPSDQPQNPGVVGFVGSISWPGKPLRIVVKML